MKDGVASKPRDEAEPDLLAQDVADRGPISHALEKLAIEAHLGGNPERSGPIDRTMEAEEALMERRKRFLPPLPFAMASMTFAAWAEPGEMIALLMRPRRKSRPARPGLRCLLQKPGSKDNYSRRILRE